MKTLLILVLVISSYCSFAEDLKPYYKIISQNWNETAPQDSITIFGKVKYDKLPANDNFGKISSLDFRTANIVKRSGDYQITIHHNAKGIYFFQNGYKEVVINLKNLDQYNNYNIDIKGETHLTQILVEKPVIYCYSPKPIETEIYLSPKGNLTFTYPIYNKSWHIRTASNGEILNLKTGKTHPYLFWEASQEKVKFNFTDQSMSAFIVKTDTIITFLENQLEKIGLNDREATDFITYWGPRLQHKEFVLIQFLVNSDYNKVFGDIDFEKRPDCMLRVGMLFSSLDNIPNSFKINPQEFEPLNREGFTVIEWGGVELKE